MDELKQFKWAWNHDSGILSLNGMLMSSNPDLKEWAKTAEIGDTFQANELYERIENKAWETVYR